MTDLPVSCLHCPVCGEKLALHKDSGCDSLRCTAGHSFDIARSGYVNLLRPGRQTNKNAGDDKKMVAARQFFLSCGYYDRALDYIINVARTYVKPDGIMVDCGCGTGYYSNKTAADIKSLYVIGLDASKHAVEAAAKGAAAAGLSGRTVYITAALARQPISEQSADMTLSMFSPCDYGEFARILKPGGILLIGSAGENHLYEMRRLLYGEENVRTTVPIAHEALAVEYGFTPVVRECVEYDAVIHGADKIEALYSMTPFYWRSPAEGAKRLREKASLSTRLSFDFTLLQKK